MKLSVSFFFFFFTFIYFWLHWVFIAVRGLSLVAASGGYSSLQCAGFSLRWLLLLRSTGSRRAGFSSCGSWALERRLSSCGAQAYWLRGMWDLPGPGLEPLSPPLAGRFSTTAPPGKSSPYLCAISFPSLSPTIWLPLSDLRQCPKLVCSCSTFILVFSSLLRCVFLTACQ